LAPDEPSGPRDLRLFRLFGIQFTANWSWTFLLALLVYVAATTFRGVLVGVRPLELWLLAIVAALLCVVSLYAHELAHALVARRFGIPVRTISLFLLGGMAHITRESPTPRAEFLIALAGPLTSLLIGTSAGVWSWLVWGISPPLGALGLWLALMNIPLAILNLVPAYPLDGGRVLRAVLWFAGQDVRWGSVVSARIGQVAALGLLFAGVYVPFHDPTNALSGLWLILTAWFMYAGAVNAQHAAVFSDALRRLTVAAVMDRHYGRVEAGVSVQTFAEQRLVESTQHQHVERSGLKAYAVYRDDRLIGLLSLRRLGRIPVQVWGQTAVERATIPIEAAPSLEPSAPALGALHLLTEEGVEQVAVMAEGRLLGLITRADLARAATR
jgi:Zn-dependent protease/CBS domain-containing protein